MDGEVPPSVLLSLHTNFSARCATPGGVHVLKNRMSPPPLPPPVLPRPPLVVVGTYFGSGPTVFQMSAAPLRNKLERIEIGRSTFRSCYPSYIVTLASSQKYLVIPETPHFVDLPMRFFASDDEDEQSDSIYGSRWKPEARAVSGDGVREGGERVLFWGGRGCLHSAPTLCMGGYPDGVRNERAPWARGVA